MNRNRLYAFLLLACVAGTIWLLYNLNSTETTGVCLFKGITNIPCPSCGSTRAIESLLHGDVMHSLKINPFGVIVALILFITPFWIIADIIIRRNSLYKFYQGVEKFFQRPRVLIPFALFVLVNWIWTISKEL
jgi:hypothetical protein